jgi:NAD(P)-dependent dehydrogenase (short-subunit alcohol dehydrogenase family)
VLTSFGRPLHAVVIGASGGIGAALADQLATDPGVQLLTRLSRPVLDLERPETIEAAAAALPMPPDLVICATGLLHAPGMMPERAMKELDAATLARSFAVNAIGPALVAKAFLPLMPRDRRTVFAALSARVGSISDNRIGGWHGYRAAKAALNQLIRTLAIEQSRRAPESLVLALHPGTVDTGLSKPFQKMAKMLITPDEAAAHLLAVIDSRTPADSGRLFDWQGLEVQP